jgi:hypothetical protein
VIETKRESRLLAIETDTEGGQHVRIDLTPCYSGLPKAARVVRDVWLKRKNGLGAVVRDELTAVGDNVEIRYSWTGGYHLGWSFERGWARLSDSRRALWIGTTPGGLAARELQRHPGTRGPLTLSHVASLPGGSGTHWWIFVCDPQGGWTNPVACWTNGTLRVSGLPQLSWKVQ